ncbi:MULTISPECIES: helix-turn-helix transcriptional regulator [unclassified Myroides]|uniref:helix-turn-helix transcriptional regulator n=1 Tax=unclassified Myroides TaxID=2642485 RepID=UPI003D2F7E2A
MRIITIVLIILAKKQPLIKTLFYIFVCSLGLICGCFAQDKTNAILEKEFQKLDSITASSEIYKLLQAIQSTPNTQDKTKRIIGYHIRLADLYAQEFDGLNKKSTELYKQVFHLAEQVEDLSFQTYVYSKIGFYYYSYNHYTDAYIYFKKSTQGLDQRTNEELFNGYEVLKQNAFFFQTLAEYEMSTAFLNRALHLTSPDSKSYGTILNALGINSLNTNQLLTAENYFLRTKQSAIDNQDSIRYAKALGDLARVEILRNNWDKAEQLLLEDIAISTQLGEFRNAMFAQLQLGKMYFKQEKNVLAKQTLLQVKNFANSKTYLKIYEKESADLLLQIAKLQKNKEEEIQLYRELDLLNLQVKKEDQVQLDKIALNYQLKGMEGEYKIQKMQLEKSQLLQQAWFFISFLLIIIVLLLYILYRRRIKLNTVSFKNKILGFQYDKIQIEAKLAEANNSLDSFHTYIESKNKQISQLEKDILRIRNRDQKNSLEDLLTSHLMTDDNWSYFKQAFREEQAEYYTNLVRRFPHLTESNLRIILLQKIGLNNQEISQIIGITPDAVKKAKQRLRKKHNEHGENPIDFTHSLDEQD